MYKRESMGIPPFSRPTLIAVIFYAMYSGYFSTIGIIRFAEDSIGAQWILNGMKMPSYKTVERTINSLLEEMDNFFHRYYRYVKTYLLSGKSVYI